MTMTPRARRQGRDLAVGSGAGFPPLLLGALLVLLPVGASLAQSPLVAELRAFSVRYHEDPPRLDALRNGLQEAAKTDPDVETLLALAQVSFIWGDIRASTSDQRLEAYERGREAARRVVERDARNPTAHFWYATNTARWGQTKGVLRSLFLLPTVREEIETILRLDAAFPAVYALAGNVFYEVPGLFGGDLDRAEEMFRKGLALDPSFTGMRVGLAKTLLKKGRIAEARQELWAVLEEKDPHNLADWTLKDAKEARELLDSLKEKSSASSLAPGPGGWNWPGGGVPLFGARTETIMRCLSVIPTLSLALVAGHDPGRSPECEHASENV